MPEKDFTTNIYWQLLGTLMAAKRKLGPILDSHNITGVQAYILVSLSLDSGKPMSYLAEQLRCDASNITSLVDKLESAALLERRADSADRRIKLLFLTAKGSRVCRQLINDINTLETTSLDSNRLSKTKVSEAIRILQKLV